MKRTCPLTKESCNTKCVGYCNLLKKRLYKPVLELKQCPVCHEHLIPYGGFWLHPDNNCKFGVMLEVEIKPHSKDYEDTLGLPTYTFEELIEELTTHTTITTKLCGWIKSVWNSLLAR